MSIFNKIKKSRKKEEELVTTKPSDFALSSDDVSTEEADTDLSEINTIQEFIEMKRLQNQILEKLLEKIVQSDKPHTNNK